MTVPDTSATAGQTSTGLAPNVAGALAYALGPISGVAFLMMEKENRFVRFHAAQSVVISLAMFAVSIALTMASGILSFIPLLGWLLVSLVSMGISLASLALWVFLMWKAYQGETWRAPVLAELAERIAA